MNKYELALVVDAKIEEDARVATVEKAKDYVTKFGGTITEVEEWGQEETCLRDSAHERGLLLLHQV